MGVVAKSFTYPSEVQLRFIKKNAIFKKDAFSREKEDFIKMHGGINH